MNLQTENLNLTWANLLIEELARWGCEYACISPGSRSTPLTVATARHEKFTSKICLDERAAAFYALGYARATGRPAVLICTSGSALAHYLPAVIEASQDRVPLLILSADRPPELLHTGANQAIQQIGIFSDYLRWSFDLPCPNLEIPPEMVLTTLDQALFQAQTGPVQINCHFREPLAPLPSPIPVHYLDSILPWTQGTFPYTQYQGGHLHLNPAELEKLAEKLNPARTGLLLVGRLKNNQEKEAILQFSQTLGWPVFADILSGLAHNPRVTEKVNHFDPLLVHPEFQNLCRPEVILHLGGEMTSARLNEYISSYRQEEYLRVCNHSERNDSLHQISQRLIADLPSFCEALAKQLEPSINRIWVKTLQNRSAAAEMVLSEHLDQNNMLSEPALVRQLSQILPSHSALMIGNSMPIRDFDMFASAMPAQACIFGNRGASGIDGNLATALGLGEGNQALTTLLLGDLALLHDLNALSLVKTAQEPLILIVINNDGGGIFSFLPIAQAEDVFESHFGTPHGFQFKGAAEMFGLNYVQPQTLEDFKTAYLTAVETRQHTLIEIQTKREANFRLHQEIHRQIGERLRGET
ncbi:2-succinyl-5-enolpyruvyl-6-hydroxy-3-cyclohexene-1-carboxylic-acid synthase [bacterium (Candidatus Blackallbacteria) CG17_big_fil_post_rev_8_21_14_2_50_48_46]|uniref:2-succinyl-5-enolpyruvyl-6-hydroxy-3-cyclohexene-1-carboxylate synthase n=1 Tax=bacterium (Candidatus Blackallbacteria) CG17_big_fil_post_rev_8_21_14_2_50_48_46 TaxID=2014261 RepID=A0A2M7G9T0_9BACT|nr:MAG: 2-succinyl-5-enolpyruvyl-6-hydroxy-3-cyclohexene-1-carboxylic-acid synthase [bacterium (Candidatus Blackallbacteria) CG18_big_fil_WC_8_21_14_2_50_49_26]PIW18624.1 MAG: 2-succinyl-5-enolpyruvyl-6-hydroxy-3-cyclohexene-1-carboxylic-acid synthase [bacterium (Candidatus Blackallbacteria) CG17_big_fil_post_rev_8_21_14_2_50_48_46]PIW46390.1 MAG: 2-succinyl-5-enolpyruvyl-6-hydroxy-3-cyclohexene-1-carboxylic-acid synthase [bacterium (Candidatus Blackallbacteria) CG13_big_fil_rev_8_21_14_2_50_49_1